MKIKSLNIFLILLLFLSMIGSVNAVDWDKNPDTNLLYEKAKLYQADGMEWVIVKLDSSKLNHGDYIQLRNYKDEAFFYLNKDGNGNIYFSDTYGVYYLKQEDFNRLYTGYALLIN